MNAGYLIYLRQIALVLPPEDTILLTRELIYTGITRARQSVTLWSDEQVFSAAVKRRTERRSGLRERLRVSFYLSS
jgi:exodeoxyribonuclease V alpha subunit